MEYPPNWSETRQEILDRAGNKCEFCGVPNKTEVMRFVVAGLEGHWATADGKVHDGDGHRVYDVQPFAPECRPAFIVLTIARMDHNPANFDPGNLKALCQRCNVRHNGQHKADAVRATRAKHKEERQMRLEGL